MNIEKKVVELQKWKWCLIILCTVIVLPLDIWISRASSDEITHQSPVVQYVPQETDEVLHNPFIGMAPPALNGPYPQAHRLVYAVLTWREVEPIRGEYAFEEIESTYKFSYWHDQGSKVILRFVLDYGDSKGGMDIPDWVYEEIQGDGIWYDEDVGKGFSPHYDNPRLIKLHEEVIAKLGERYNQDDRVAFIALGSLGHWGEWHTYYDDTIHIPFPKLAVSDLYAEHYSQAFPDKHLLMRRPHPIAKEQKWGLYNDMFGSHAATVESFLDWIENGYTSMLAASEMPAMPEFWLHAPSGGEFAHANQVRSYFTDEKIGEVIMQAQRSHTSWLGPSNPAGLVLSDTQQENLNRLLNTMGYRFVVRSVHYRLTAEPDVPHILTLVVENKGVAPFYYRWPIELAISNDAGEIVSSTIMQDDIRRWLPGLSKTVQTLDIPKHLAAGTYMMTIAILDPSTDQPGVSFAMEGRREDGRYEIGVLRIEQTEQQPDAELANR